MTVEESAHTVSGKRSPLSLNEIRAAVRVATEAVAGLRGVLWQAGGPELEMLLGEVDALAAGAAGARVSVTVEAVRRGEVSASQHANTAAWVRAHAPSLAAGGYAQLARVVTECTAPSRADELSPVLEATCDGRVPAPVSARVLAEYEKLRHDVRDEVAPTVLAGLVSLAESDGLRGVCSLRPRLLAEYGRDGQLQREQDRAAHLVELSTPIGDDVCGWTYRFTTDAPGKAILEAALMPLTRPCPGPDGAPDPRSAVRRRGEALLQLVSHAVAATTAAASVGGNPATMAGVKSTLLLTATLADLRSGVGAATALGAFAETVLAPQTARRQTCDTTLVPVLVDEQGRMLRVGAGTRLFGLSLLRALWWRDRGCTFPGCDQPAWACEAHHLLHWIDGGPTTLVNAGLLCGRHHTVCHRDRLHGEVRDNSVIWDTTPGSYDRARASPAA